MWKEDIERLKSTVDISEVVSALGIETRRNGSNVFMRCPLPSHDDEHPTNCYFKPGGNFCYCTVCRKRIGAIDLITFVKGCTFGEAADFLRRICHAPGYEKEEHTEKTETFFLTAEEAKLLGIQWKSKVYAPKMQTKERLSSPNALKTGYSYASGREDYLLTSRSGLNLDWSDFFNEDELKQLVLTKASQKEKQLKEVEGEMKTLGLSADFSEDFKLLSALKRRARKNGKKCA